MGAEPKPCPFCQGQGVLCIGHHLRVDAKVVCRECGAEGQVFGTDAMDGDFRPEAIAAWNTRAAQPSQWQPISTAPKDGTNVLLFNDKGNMAVGLWLEGVLGAGWYLRGGNRPDSFFNGGRATYWQPIPAAPDGGEKGAA